MNGSSLMAEAMGAAQARLDLATANLSQNTTDGYHRMVFHAMLTSHGITTQAQVDTTPLPLRHTGDPLDVFLTGGRLLTVDGRCLKALHGERDQKARLIDTQGDVLRGRHGAAAFPLGARIDEQGGIFLGTHQIDHLVMTAGARLHSGLRVVAQSDPARDMVEILQAERWFETDQKVVLAIDGVRTKDANEIGRPSA